MAEIIEILTVLPNAVTPYLGIPHFTVDTAQTSVEVHGSQGFKLCNGAGRSVFQAGDNILLLSMGYTLPESFAVANPAMNANAPVTELPTLDIASYYADDLNNSVRYLAEYSFVPMPNFEMPNGVYYNSTDPTLLPKKYILKGSFSAYPPFSQFRISMVNVPLILNGTLQMVNPFIKILHNLPLVDE